MKVTAYITAYDLMYRVANGESFPATLLEDEANGYTIKLQADLKAVTSVLNGNLVINAKEGELNLVVYVTHRTFVEQVRQGEGFVAYTKEDYTNYPGKDRLEGEVIALTVPTEAVSFTGASQEVYLYLKELK